MGGKRRTTGCLQSQKEVMKEQMGEEGRRMREKAASARGPEKKRVSGPFNRREQALV